MNLASLFEGPSLILFIILLCSLVATTIFIERILFFRRAETNVNDLLIKLRPQIQEGNLLGAIEVCEEAEGATARILVRGLSKFRKTPEEMQQAIEISALSEMAELEKNAKILSLLAHIAPLIGLLGTVLGFIQAFAEMRQSGLADITTTRIGEAMEYALITTAAGLAVAIPCVIAYNYLVSKVEVFALEMRVASHDVMEMVASRDDYEY